MADNQGNPMNGNVGEARVIGESIRVGKVFHPRHRPYIFIYDGTDYILAKFVCYFRLLRITHIVIHWAALFALIIVLFIDHETMTHQWTKQGNTMPM